MYLTAPGNGANSANFAFAISAFSFALNLNAAFLSLSALSSPVFYLFVSLSSSVIDAVEPSPCIALAVFFCGLPEVLRFSSCTGSSSSSSSASKRCVSRQASASTSNGGGVVARARVFEKFGGLTGETRTAKSTTAEW